MRVYVAGPWRGWAVCREVADGLERAGHRVTSSWIGQAAQLDGAHADAAPERSDELIAQDVATDLAEVADSDVLLLVTAAVAGQPAAGSGGRHVETGWALAKGVRVIVLGEPENIFHRPQRQCGDLGGVLEALKERVVCTRDDWCAAVHHREGCPRP